MVNHILVTYKSTFEHPIFFHIIRYIRYTGYSLGQCSVPGALLPRNPSFACKASPGVYKATLARVLW